MASFIHHALFLVLVTLFPTLFLLYHTHNLVMADDKLIYQQCHDAEAPELCIQCVKSDSGVEEADKVGIATIIIICLDNHSKSLTANMRELASETEDKKLKSFYESCIKGYSITDTNLLKVVSCLKDGDYDNANSFVVQALEYQLMCHLNFEEPKWKLPTEVVYEMKVYEALSQAALRIIDRL